ncbi:MAG: rRNA cytosine-C5-methylase [Arachnia propionica]|nr:MAG: rRNA cytosine-C5-methylase [Arachnia propionica]
MTNPRSIAFTMLRRISADGAYANLVLNEGLGELSSRDARFVTELVAGTCRRLGTYDRIIARAANRSLNSLQPAVVDVLRLGAHQLLAMRVPSRAAVDTSVKLARSRIGQRVTGLVNAVLRKVAAHTLAEWTALLSADESPTQALATRTHHPLWIVQAYQQLLAPTEVARLLAANNEAATPTLVVRPGLLERDELLRAGGTATRFSPYGVHWQGNPGRIPAVIDGRAGVQDEGSQLVALALSRATAPSGPWLDLCAGPGGKSALLAGLAAAAGSWLLASELQEHRARLVQSALRAYPSEVASVISADGRQPAWRPNSFAKIMVDAPCTGLGALRRRPESRWRHQPEDVPQLAGLQRELVHRALDSAIVGGAVAYVTCSPHAAETADVVHAVVAERDDVAIEDAAGLLPEVAGQGRFIQLWPHKHGTDAMFFALLRKR